MSSGFSGLPGAGNPAWKGPVTTASLLPSSNNNPGDVRVAEDTGTIYAWNGSEWVAAGGGGGGGGESAFVHSLTSLDISNKYISLPAAPTLPTSTLLTVVDGPMQQYGS